MSTDIDREQLRLRTLESYSILDTLPEEDYDNLTAIAAQICGTPIALVSFVDVDRQWFKSKHGLQVSETPKAQAFCAHAIDYPESPMIVEDARKDNRFSENPLVTGEPYVIFYAGVPLINEANGMALGTLCVIDHEPRVLTEDQRISLRALAKQTMKLLDLRKRTRELEEAKLALEEKNEELTGFATLMAHDLKSPLNEIRSALALEKAQNTPGKEKLDLLDHARNAMEKLMKMIDDLLVHSQSEKIVRETPMEVSVPQLQEDMNRLFNLDNRYQLVWHTTHATILVNRTALEHILLNLIGNALKFNHQQIPEVHISLSQTSQQGLSLVVSDNGPGIEDKEQSQVFKMFERGRTWNKDGRGIGLATVKKMVESLRGEITLHSTPGAGTQFAINIPHTRAS